MKIKNLILLIYTLQSFLTTPIIIAGQLNAHLSSPIKIPDAPPPRDIFVLLDNGSENTYNSLMNNSIDIFNPMPITYQVISQLQSKAKTPLFASESLINNIIINQIIVKDFLTLSEDELQKKYSSIAKFSSLEVITAFKNICTILIKNNNEIKTAFDAFQKNKSEESLNNLNTLIMQAKTHEEDLINDVSIKLFKNDKDKGESFVTDIIYNYIKFNKALNLSEWSIGRTIDGSYLLLPKDSKNMLEKTGLNYSHLNGFSDNQSLNPFDDFNNNIKKAFNDKNVNTDESVNELIKIIKIKQNTASNNPSTITFNPEDHSKLNIYIAGHGGPKTSQSNGTIAAIDIDTFKSFINILENSYTQTLTYETCFGGDINAAKSFEDTYGKLETHSFSIINGTSSLTPLGLEESTYLFQISSLIEQELTTYKKTGIFSTPDELKQKMIDVGLNYRLDNYFNIIKSNIANGVLTALNNRYDGIYKLTGNPLIKLSTTNTWLPAKNIGDDILQVHNFNDLLNSTNKTSFEYNSTIYKGILISEDTILSPIEIQINSNLPLMVPLSVGKNIHYIKEIIIKDPSITTAAFINQSIKPFIDQMNIINKNTNIADKIIVIGSLHTKEGICAVVITKHGAFYSIDIESENNLTGEKPLHIIEFEKNFYSWLYKDTFKESLEAAHNQETQKLIILQKIQNISSAIASRQKTLNVIKRLKGITNINLGINDQKTIWDAVKKAIKENDNSALSKEFLSTFTRLELQTFCNILGENIFSVSFTDPIAQGLSETLQMAYKQLDYKKLQETLNFKSIDIKTALDWYATLSLEDQLLIKFDLNIVLEKNIQDLLDPNTLTAKQEFLVENYLKTTASLTINQEQQADLETKIKALTSPRDETKFNTYLKDRLNQLIALPDKTAFIDFIANLIESEKAPINLDITAFITEKVSFDPEFNNNFSLNITELFTVKTIIEKFFNSSYEDQNIILQKVSEHYKQTITLDNFTQRLTLGSQTIENGIVNSFNSLNYDHQTLLIVHDSIDTYAQIFKTLSFETQKKIINNLPKLKTAQQDVLKYQQSLVDDRIKTATSFDDLVALKTDIANTKDLILTHQQSTTLDAKFHQAQDTYNRARAKQLPLPASTGSTGNSIFNQPFFNQDNGKTVIILPDPKNPNNPTDPTKHEVFPGQLIPEGTKDFENKDLEANKERLEEEQKDREDTSTAARDNNKAAQDEAKKRKESGNDEPVVFEL